MVKLDLKDTYFAVSIHLADRMYLTFQFQSTIYQFKCLPFSLSSAPRVFTKIMQPVTVWLRQMGCRMISYIDYNLILAASRQEAKLWGKLAVALLEGLGFTVNHKKSNLEPSQETQFLGFMINARAMTISVTADKLAGIRASTTRLEQRSLVSERSLAMFIGKATSMKLAIPPAPLFYQALHTAKTSIDLQAQSIDSPVQLGSAQWEELTWWIEQAQLWNGYFLRPPKQVLMIQTDEEPCVKGGPWAAHGLYRRLNITSTTWSC